MSESEFEKNAAEVLFKCGRHCCVCRRFRPTMLQVHHIIEQSKGGGDEIDNLIAACLTCHSDVHAHRPFSQRFSADEQKRHRDRVYDMVARGILVAPNDDAVLDGPQHPSFSESGAPAKTFVITRPDGLIEPRLMKEAVEVLTAAANSADGVVLMCLDTGGVAVSIAGRNFVPSCNPRDEARYKQAVNQLIEHDLLDGFDRVFRVTHRGYLLADALESACSNQG